jgi:hypothetical protein
MTLGSLVYYRLDRGRVWLGIVRAREDDGGVWVEWIRGPSDRWLFSSWEQLGALEYADLDPVTLLGMLDCRAGRTLSRWAEHGTLP